ncbi:major facilitator superfamily MFS_1 [Methylocaldum marinum]|uniref:Major facilitator superfamily MFS_1 n=1 Tax=Methylocaldum marinum TaxID=1432792 RepID=A0A250KR34_9GAMM|nr:MFS transporter [Methylocaldum marinum]BBA34012.1 major facilitator superfamily MFS_1 [Methylocaldum marinum]
MSAARKVPYGRLSGFYFFYFSALGAFLPYWALYLRHTGFSAPEIGQLIAITAATRVVAPNLWGWLADRTGRTLSVVRLAGFFTLLAFSLVFGVDGFTGFALVMLVFSFFWNAMLPLFETITLHHLRHDTHRYSWVRVWGSIGFIAAVVTIGEALDGVLAIEFLPQLILLLFGGLWLISLTVPREPGEVHGPNSASLSNILRRGDVIAFFLACTLQQVAHGPYYVFFSVYLRDHGFSSGETGQLWALGVLAEIVLFAFLHRLLARYSLRRIFLASLVLSVVRWLLIAWGIDNFAAIVAAQLLHAASFGSAHVAAIHLVHQYFRGPHHGKGQAFYSALSFGLGGALGSLYSGHLWTAWGAQWVYTAAAGSSLAALLLAWTSVGKRAAN